LVVFVEVSGMEVMIVVGTRPEGIKLAPVIKKLAHHARLKPFVVATGQHREMLTQVFDWFNINPDIDLAVMRPNQTLNSITAAVVNHIDLILNERNPGAVLVQGDTTSAFAAAVAAFYCGIPVGHVEAGLRTYDLNAPFPEEANRAMISRIARWHFAPTINACNVLKSEGVLGRILVTGNTVVDALLDTASRLPDNLSSNRRLVLITGHRRENFGARFAEAFTAIGALAARFPDVDFVYPVHMNPNVRSYAHSALGHFPNVTLTEPLSYPKLVSLLKRATLVLTDSGGIQEAAPTFGTPVLVMRDKTERPEAVEAGVAVLVGTRADEIVRQATRVLSDATARHQFSARVNPYGDGTASARIVSALEQDL
jgi:UDP-N-acetylglucosamine 2-epimerase (non-hydrolysing)